MSPSSSSTAPSRTSRAALNVAVGVGVQVVLLALSIVNRTVFVRALDIETLGVHALFLNVIALVTMVEFGLSTSVMYALYQPLNSRDENRISAIVAYCSRLYRRISVAVLVVGLPVAPFLDRIVSTEEPVPGLQIYYLVLLGSSSLQYLMAHRVVLLMADQRDYTTRLYFLLTEVLRTMAQIAVLLAYGSYLGFLIVQAITTVAYNFLLFRLVGREYPGVHRGASLDDAQRKDIGTSIRAMLVYRVSGALLNSTDGVIISAVVGTVALGLYSNYALIIGAAVVVAETAFRGVGASVGNLVAGKGAEGARSVFWELSLVSFAFYSVASLVLLVSLDDLVGLWLGGEFLVEDWVLWTAVANFYLVGALSPVMLYRTGTGMFRDTKYVLLVTAALNLALSLALGSHFGIAGVLGASVVARLFTSAWYEPLRLLQAHLGEPPSRYFAWQGLCCGLLLLQAFIYTRLPFERLDLADWAVLVARSVAVAVLASIVVGVTFWRTASMRSFRVRLRLLL